MPPPSRCAVTRRASPLHLEPAFQVIAPAYLIGVLDRQRISQAKALELDGQGLLFVSGLCLHDRAGALQQV